MRPPMSPDDPRHGSTAGYSEHMRSDRTPCQPCRRANNVRPSKGVNFIASGYDPKDALEGGRWMWDDRRAIRVWVQTEPVQPDPQGHGDDGLPVPQEEPVADLQVPVCACGARAHERCKDASGKRVKNHRTRQVSRCCPCGRPLSDRRGSWYCDFCREKARRKAYRKAYQKRTERQIA